MKKPKSVRFNMLIPPALLRELQQCAEQQGLNMSQFVKEAIREAIKKAKRKTEEDL